jgi:hypothetical protein
VLLHTAFRIVRGNTKDISPEDGTTLPKRVAAISEIIFKIIVVCDWNVQ